MRRFVSERACRLKRGKSFGSFRGFASDRSGAVLIYTGLIITALLGFGGLAVDAGMWYATKRSAQSAADAAALAGALEVARGSDSATVLAKATNDAQLNGYSAATGATITINNPPNFGPNTTDNRAVEAIVQQPVPGFLSSILHKQQVTVAARAVARGYVADSCVYVMNPSASAALSVPGTTTVDMDCGAQVNSVSPTAIKQTGSSCMTATQIATSGGASGTCLNPQPDENMPQTEDPFSYLSPPAAASGPCDYTTLVTISTPSTLNPGNYCGGLTITKDVDFNPGEYVIGGQGLQIQGNSVITGDEVSFYFPPTVTGSPTSPPRSLYIAGTTEVHLSAPTTGDYQSVLFYNDPGVSSNIEMWLQGGSDMDLTGVIYAPNNHLRFAGGTNGVGGWTVLATDTLEFTGNSNVSGTLPPVDLPLALIRPTLVE